MKKIGLLINPIAGMGGSVGLKGTDGEKHLLALERGASPIAEIRTEQFLSILSHQLHSLDVQIITCKDPMGHGPVKKTGLPFEIIPIPRDQSIGTSSEDTVRACQLIEEKGACLLVFVGGDGTSVDVLSSGINIPVLGVPSGVKMFGGVFGLSPDASAEVVVKFLTVETPAISEGEVMDIDEDAYRENHLSARLIGYLKVPSVPSLMQSTKATSPSTDTEQENLTAIAEEIKERFSDHKKEEKDILVIAGPGTTTKRVFEHMNVDKTLLGVDVILGTEIIAKDASENQILDAISRFPDREIRILLTPLGGMGVLLGRGNQQISPAVLRKAGGKKSLIIIASLSKIATLEHLHVDTRDPDLDKELKGFIRVIVDYNVEKLVKIS
ncbi:MAG: ATP-NAD kinase family protein [Candidatus Odinarchaeota archaeon]